MSGGFKDSGFKFDGSGLAGGGGQFSGIYGGGSGSYTMERIVRPFVTIDSEPPPPAKPKRAIPGDSGEASICIGGPSRFLQSEQSEPSRTTRFEYSSSSTQNDEEETEDGERIYTETARTVSVIRVENPDDAAQYVDVERIESIDFIAPDGGTVRFVLNHA